MILIVDDKPENLFSLRSLLTLHNYEVDTAISGEEALKKILKREYAVIILDVQMPGMDGYEVAEAVTGLNKTKDIPIIFLSAVNIDKRFIKKGFDSGGVDYITKPFDSDYLLLKVKTFNRLYDQTRQLKQAGDDLRKEIKIRQHAQEGLEQLNNTLEKRVEDRTAALSQLNKELEANNAELAQYAMLASHDLQEPLRKIIFFSNLISDRYEKNNESYPPELNKVIRSASRMRQLINDLLTYSKISHRNPFTTVDLGDVLKETLDNLELVIREKSAQVECADLPVIDAVPAQMGQLFQNILSNALKFSRQSPRIHISFDYINEKNTEARALKNGEYLRLFIQDNGIGFDEQYSEKVFEIFRRLEHNYEGTGIGLALVKKIIEKHNGSIAVKSKKDEGSTFIIVLPRKQQEESTPN